MYAVEFDANIENGIVHIPKKYTNLQEVSAKVTIMIDDSFYLNEKTDQKSDNEILAFSNNSANSIDEWKDEKEDEVWV